MTAPDRLPPWARLTVSCERCQRPATVRCFASDFVINRDGDGAVTATLSDESAQLSHLACDEHSDEITGEICDIYGAASADALRDPWRYFLETRVPGLRWIGRLRFAWDEWQFDRQMARSSQCAHNFDPSSGRCLRGCGAQLLGS